MKAIIIFLSIIFLSTFNAQNLEINKIEPQNWWANHSYNHLQLMVYGKNLDSVRVEVNNSNIFIEKIIHTSNQNYAFIKLTILPDANSGEYMFSFSNKHGSQQLSYFLYERDTSNNIHQGFSNNDAVYLIFPDRFVDGDTTNNFNYNVNEEFEFGSLNGRHGGDIQGMIDKLDYLQNLGITAIWSTPLVENKTYMSYHGYAATDFYKIDPRLGNNELYREFVNKAHEKGIKVILDHVSNHIGINHEWVRNLPTETWLHGSPQNHQPADHNKTALVDIHADKNSIRDVNLGWFADSMPDLNQTDTLLAKYIIQNTIWWIEYSGIDGIREDTYPYSDQKFMAGWAKEILLHYPNLNIVGEVWKGDPAILAAFQTKSYFPKKFDTNLPVVTDFAIRDAIFDYMSGKSELNQIYEVLGKDFVYSNPNNLLVFFDNHDTDRGMYAAKWDIHKYKAALALILTTRGIPQLFYGTEIGLDGGGHHGRIREEFPGGFPGNEKNSFTEIGRNNKQNDIYEFTKTLLNLRKKYKVLRTGELIQFPPKKNLYIYFKKNENQTIAVVINDSDEKELVDFNYYFSNLNNFNKLTNLFDSKVINVSNNNLFEVPGKSVSIYLIN